jgi:hypothetical protein
MTDEEVELIVFNDLIPIDETRFGVLGYRQDCCDCSERVSFYQIRSLEDGALINEINEIVGAEYFNNAFVNEDYDAALTAWGFVVVNFNADTKTIFNFDLDGNLLNTYATDAGGEDRSVGFIGDFVMDQQEQIYRFDQFGNPLDSIQLSDVWQLESSALTLAVLDNQLLRFYDDDFEIISSIPHSGGDVAVFGSDNGFYFFDNGTMTRLNDIGDIESSGPFEILPGLRVFGIAAQDDFYILAGDKTLSVPNFIFSVWHHHAAWQMHGVEGPAPLWHVDLGLTDLTIDDIEIVDQIGNTQYEATVTVTVSNDGTFPSSDFHLNNVESDGLCFNFYENHFIETSVSNQDEITVTLENITGFGPPQVDGSVELEICIFLTSPLENMDADNSNDLICVNEIFFLSTDDIDLGDLVSVYPNPAKDFLQIESQLSYSEIRLVNALGQTVVQRVANDGGRLDTSTLEAGIYVLQLTTEKGMASKKILITD